MTGAGVEVSFGSARDDGCHIYMLEQLRCDPALIDIRTGPGVHPK